MREIIRMLVVLTAVSVISGFGLAAMYEKTKEPIRLAELNQVYAPQLKVIVKGFDNDPIKEAFDIKYGKDKKGKDIIKTVFPCKKGGQLFAVAMDDQAAGFGGNVKVLTAIDIATDKVIDIAILTHAETKGIGTALQAPFMARFKDLLAGEPVALKADGGKIDGMSGATYSSKAITTAVANAMKFYKDKKAEILKNAK